ncbi:hypothetical protein IEO21_03609 [Rhodonia placenta]|uniref:Uncharacterized protein n=1 Tax=Rhodonia placenta TaxID=104341 RepID=A0A8H7P5D9_9APHY|nr:hypothetical protein IEO21_03609 [Postia placenta]
MEELRYRGYIQEFGNKKCTSGDMGVLSVSVTTYHFTTHHSLGLSSTSLRCQEREDLPVLKNPPPETIFELYINRAALCADERIVSMLLGDDPTPKVYYDAFLRNMQFVFHYVNSVGLEDFKTASAEPDTPLTRARSALVVYARLADQWLSAALQIKGPHHSVEDLAKATVYVHTMISYVDAHEAEMVPWDQLCDAILTSFRVAVDPVIQAAGGVPEDFIEYDEPEADDSQGF